MVEQLGFLRNLRRQGIQCVLILDHLGTRGIEAREVHPDGLITEGLRAGGDGDGNAVMAKTHADIADDNGIFGHFQRFIGEDEILHA